MQTYTSSATSINRSKLPAVYGRTCFSASAVLDYGCGKYTDHIRTCLRRQGCVLLPYDPYNQPTHVNRISMNYVERAMREHCPVDVVCSNVLNVIDDEEEVRRIAGQIEDIVRRTGGVGYVTVYEGDRSGVGRRTGVDQYQRNAPLRSYLGYFRNATVRNGMIIVGG